MYVFSHRNFNFHTKDDRYRNVGFLVHVPISKEPQPVPNDIADTMGFKLALGDGAISIVKTSAPTKPAKASVEGGDAVSSTSADDAGTEGADDSADQTDADEASDVSAEPAEITQDHADFLLSRGYPAGRSIASTAKKIKRMSKKDRTSFFAEFNERAAAPSSDRVTE